jgi:hypothetical protein
VSLTYESIIDSHVNDTKSPGVTSEDPHPTSHIDMGHMSYSEATCLFDGCCLLVRAEFDWGMGRNAWQKSKGYRDHPEQ